MKLRQFDKIGVSFIRLTGFFAVLVSLAACTTTEQSPKLQLSATESSVVTPLSRPDMAVAYAATEPSLERGAGRVLVGASYQVKGVWYHPEKDDDYAKEGHASWYGSQFHGRLTANGEIYDKNHLTAAHPTMPLPSYAKVTNLENGSSVIVRVNDRGPFAKDRIIDLSEKAADMLAYRDDGVANVKVEYVGPAPVNGQDDAFLMASFKSGSENAVNASIADSTKDYTLPKLPEIGPVVLPRPDIVTSSADIEKAQQAYAMASFSSQN